MRIDPSEPVFDDLHRHPRVCSNCFRLRHHEDPVPTEGTRLAGRTQVAAAVTDEWTRTRWAALEYPPGTTVSEWSGTTACECGAVSPYTRERPDPDDAFPLDTVMAYVGHLDHTLGCLTDEHLAQENYGLAARYAHNSDALYDSARHLKTATDYTNDDDLIFKTAVELACRRGTVACQWDASVSRPQQGQRDAIVSP